MNNKNVLITIIVILIFGVVIYFATTSDTDIADTEQVDQEQASNSNTIPVEGGDNSGNGSSNPTNSIVLSPAETGLFVTVESATLTQPGYIVVYRVNSNSETDVIGNSDLLLPGSYSDITMQVDSPIVLEQTVVAVLHEDDGDGEFEYPGSDTYLGDPDRPIVSDVEVVDVSSEDEAEALQEQVEVFLENNLETSATGEAS